MEECVVCLEDCTMDISELRIDDCKCKCIKFILIVYQNI